MKHKTFVILFVVIMLVASSGSAHARMAARSLYANGDLLWAKNMGGIGNDVSQSMAIDSSGNIYTTGFFRGTADFDPDAGIANLTSVGVSYDIFVSKLDSSGNFIWAKQISGSGSEYGNGIAVDSDGNVYLVGRFSGSVDFDPGAGSYMLTTPGDYDIFVSKLDTNGNFVWAGRMGAPSVGGSRSYDAGWSIAIDLSGNIYTTGSFQGTADFDPGLGITNLTAAGNDDIFVSKLDNGGNLIWAKSMGGADVDEGTSIEVDWGGNVYITGGFNGTADFDPGISSYNLIGTADVASFISKLDGNGNFVWAKMLRGTTENSGSGFGTSIRVNSNGDVYTSGVFWTSVDFDPGVGTFILTSAGSHDIFVSKLDSNGNLAWARSMGGVNDDYPTAIVLDATGSVYTTGWFMGTSDFDPGAGTFNLTAAYPVDEDIFISKLYSNGAFAWAKRIGPGGVDHGYDIALDSTANVYTTGSFEFTVDLDPNAGTFNLTSQGNSDIFVSKLMKDPTFADVPSGYWAQSYIERLYAAGITGGCGSNPLMYCPGSVVTRDQMAVFLLKGKHGSNYVPPAPTGLFVDVPTNYWAAAWIEQLAAEGVTSGCTSNPLKYCPGSAVTRDQMAVFLLRAKHDSSFVPSAPTGVFQDVPSNQWAAAWIEQLAVEGVTGGCNTNPLQYCPGTAVTRDQMAVFLVRTFNLP